jgi:hypothetical protein
VSGSPFSPLFASPPFSVLITTSAQEVQRRKLVRKLNAMTALPHGWSYGQGIPVSPFAALLGATVVMIVCDSGLDADVFPNLDGSCAVAAYGGRNDKVEVSVHPTGQLGLKVEHGFGFDFEEVVAVADAKLPAVINEITNLLPRSPWKSSGFLTYVSTIEPADDSGTQSTETPESLRGLSLLTERGGFQSSIQSVPAKP